MYLHVFIVKVASVFCVELLYLVLYNVSLILFNARLSRDGFYSMSRQDLTLHSVPICGVKVTLNTRYILQHNYDQYYSKFILTHDSTSL